MKLGVFIALVILCNSTRAFAYYERVDSGIVFVQDLQWKKVLSRAKAENKFIFVDCYATWCGPCKAMDKFTYPNRKLGDFMNREFISVKFQMDSSKTDNASIQAQYEDAHLLQKDYRVTAFPTYLFLNSDGKIVHKEVGFKSAAVFEQVARDAMDEKMQYYTLLEAYNQGKRDYEAIRYLALQSSTLQDKPLAAQLANEYLKNYLDRISDDSFRSKQNLQFFEFFPGLLTPGSRAIRLYTSAPMSVDSIMGVHLYARSWVDVAIQNSIIFPAFKAAKNSASEPDWNAVQNKIVTQYGPSAAQRMTLDAKIRWARSRQNWPEASARIAEQIEKFGFDSTGAGPLLNTNEYCWNVIFSYCNDSSILDKAIGWMYTLITTPSESDAVQLYNFIDTYANLLYKRGRVAEAIEWEARAVSLNNAHVSKGGPLREELSEALQKMKQGEKTWK